MTSIELQTHHERRYGRSAGSMLGRLAAATVSHIVRAVATWDRHRRDRAAFRALLGKEDWVFRDMGIHRGDVEWASRLPMHVNASEELEKLRARSMMGR
jgi:uncharacterized protein YjiS (DUF1127 family)